MSAMEAGSDGQGERGPLTVRLPPVTIDRLRQYCLDRHVTPDEVVDRALLEYFRVGDMSH